MTVRSLVKVNLVEFIDDAAHQCSGLHVVVAILKQRLHQDRFRITGFCQLPILKSLEQRIVYKVDQFIAGDTFVIFSPIRPAQAVRDNIGVVIR